MRFRGLRKTLKHLGRTPVAHQSIGILALLFGTLTFTVHGAAFVTLLASSATTTQGATTTVYLAPLGTTTLAVGDTSDVDVNITTKVPINAIGATIAFPTDTLEIVGFSKKDSFIELWTEDASIKEDAGTVHFSGGTTKTGGLRGSATALTITIRAKKASTAELAFTEVEVYPHDGTGRQITSATGSLTYDISAAPAAAGTAAVTSTSTSSGQPATLNSSGLFHNAPVPREMFERSPNTPAGN